MRDSAPRIGLPLPTSGRADYNHKAWPEYAEAIRSAGAVAVPLELGLPISKLAAALESCAGFLLPGSPADVNPARFGEDADAATAAPDEAREECDWMVLEHAESTGKPVLGICYGLQSMNVWRGGTLVQDLHPAPVNHAAGRSVAVAHAVLVSNESLLGSLLSRSEAPGDEAFRTLPVNSSHHQAVAVPGEGFAIVARSREDAVIEGLEGRIGHSAMLGVQWHPERSVGISAASRALFAWLVSEAEDAADRAWRPADADHD